MSASRQLAQELRLGIQQGKWLAGAQLPTVRKLADDFQVSINTVHAALKQLEADDLIECRPRQGGFVKDVSQWADHVAASAPRQVAVVRPYTHGEDPSIDETQQTGRIVHGIERELERHDLHPVLLSFEVTDPQSSDKVLQQIERLRSQLTGVIVFAVGTLRGELFDALDKLGLTWVTVNRLDHRVLENFIAQDSTQCGFAIGQCLADAGTARALVVGGGTQSDIERIGGLLKGYWQRSQAKLAIEYLFVSDWREGPACETTLRYLESLNKDALPHAAVGLGDIIAVGMMRAMQSRGLRVPEDIKVISTTGLAIAKYSSPPLSAFHIPLEQMGQVAASMLVEMLRCGKRRMPGRWLSGEMVFRQSFPPSDSRGVRVLQSASRASARRDARRPLVVPARELVEIS